MGQQPADAPMALLAQTGSRLGGLVAWWPAECSARTAGVSAWPCSPPGSPSAGRCVPWALQARGYLDARS
ncbi:hypothetical protein [Streptantibioticus rubrisoli]|uniref:hypothetical protein n=1 Tax=Streptantibioticus rubrisoli TaxID=1387313 RepID=UPI0036D308E2